MADDPWRAALASLDAALEREPHKDDAVLSEAMRHLTALRDGMCRDAGATPGGRGRVELVNGTIATVFASHFPLGQVPWAELRDARDRLRAALGSTPRSRTEPGG